MKRNETRNSTMNMPQFTAESSLYRTKNQYRSTAAGNLLDSGWAAITPQGCGWLDSAICSTFIAAGTVACTALCLDGGPPACAGCWSTALLGLYGECKDCIPAWMRDLINIFEGGGGGGGGGGTAPPMCCPPGRTCRCGGRCVTHSDGSLSCVNGLCLEPKQVCP